VGYHGCHRDFAAKLIAGKVSPEEWRLSEKEYDWIGRGIYFWEYGPSRAWQWARAKFGVNGHVVAAEVHLGRCLDLGDTGFTELLRTAYHSILQLYEVKGWTLPKNTGKDEDLKVRKLDRLVLDRVTAAAEEAGVVYQTVRCPFEEGGPVFPGAKIKMQSHIQVAVRDPNCIVPRIYPVPPEGE
jgi:hypothetical protein